MAYSIETEIADRTRHHVVDIAPDPAEGQIVARIDLAAITANNVTYAVHHGPPLHYGRFFPTSDPATRITVPVWGFATITRSRARQIAEGSRWYGYWPAASHVTLTPGDIRHRAFDDTAPHRAEQAPVYNNYIPAEAVAAMPADEAFAALFRPLFGTAFALDDTLGRNPRTLTIIMTSASSKTALGLAWLLARRPGITAIGLTSPANVAFTESTGTYARVLPYDAIAELDPKIPVTIADFAGNGALLTRLHSHFQNLVATHIIGDTHWSQPQPASLPGPTPQFFFAPTAIAQMVARDGPAIFQAALAAAIARFGTEAASWLTVETGSGPDAFAAAFNPLVDGKADPAKAAIWRP